jgi:hypothetical protein
MDEVDLKPFSMYAETFSIRFFKTAIYNIIAFDKVLQYDVIIRKFISHNSENEPV